jgi:hypothetical protein
MVASLKANGTELIGAFSRKLGPPTYPTMFQNPHAEAILRDFCWHEYMRTQPDLVFACEQEARQHLVYNGYREGRICFPDRCSRLDPGYYRQRYPELLLESDERAQLHYCYVGYYEKRFANPDTEWLFNANLHVYQPGKVGSHAIAAALEGRYEGSVLHLHWPTDIALNYPSCSLTYEHILGHAREKPVKVISGARELVSRAISGAFQYLDTIGQDEVEELSSAEVIEHLEDTFLHNCDVLTSWFDHQFYCGLDIYKHQFDHEQGFVRLGNETIELFLYRHDKLPALEKSLGEFIGAPDFKLPYTNAGKDKHYSAAYKETKERLVIPKELLVSLYETPYMRFFFTDMERRRLIEYWSTKRVRI